MKIAVLGTGSMGMRHLRVLRQLDGVEVVAVPIRPERRDVLPGEGFRVARDLAAAADAGAEAVVITTDTARHLADGLTALQRGLDVLVEKPAGVDAAEARHLRDAARALGRRAYVGCVLRFSRSLNAVRERLPEVGPVHSVRIECRSYLPLWRLDRDYRDAYSARPDEGGVLRDLIHEIDYAGWLFGWPTRVWASLRTLERLGIEAEEAADLVWETAEGTLVSVGLDYLSQPTRRGLVAFGAAGTLEWDAGEGQVLLQNPEGGQQVWRFPQTRDDMVRAQAEAFLAARRGGGDPRLASMDDGERALAVCDAARAASASGAVRPLVGR